MPVGKCPLRIPGKISSCPVMKVSLADIQNQKGGVYTAFSSMLAVRSMQQKDC